MRGSFLQARLWASPSCRNEAPGQHSCNSLPRRVEKTPLYRVQMGEDPRECCCGRTSRGFLQMKKCSLTSQKIPPSFLPVQVLGESGLWVRPGAFRTSNNRRSSGHLGSLDQKAGQGASQLFFLSCRGGNAPLSTVESQIQSCVLLEVTNVPISFTRCPQPLVAYLF